MAIEKKLIHFSKLSDFETQLNAENILDYSIVFIQDAKKIWTHGQYYDCNGGNGTSDSPTFLRIGDADDEAKANFIAVANGEKSADYYICSSRVQGVPVDGIVTILNESGPTGSPALIDYTFYGSPMKGSLTGKLLKITTRLTISTSAITTTYEAVLDAKQDAIPDLEDIREGAAKGATALQPDDVSEFITIEDVAEVAKTGSYNDLVDTPTIKDEVYIADFTMESLMNGMNNSSQVDCDMQALVAAMNANKIILVREGVDSSYKGVYVLNGYAEDLLYFSIVLSYGDVLYCGGTGYGDYIQSIDGRTLHVRNWGDKQDILVSGENIKTINGESIVGSGDIIISGGGGSSAYSEVSHGTSDTTFALTPNIFHIWDEVSSLTLTLGAETSGVANEYLFQFTSGSEPTTLSLPDDIKWTGGETPTIEANKIYQISILKGLGSVLEWDSESASAIGTFSINWGLSNMVDFNFDNGMTWQDFVDSEYNTDSVIKISGSQVFYTNVYLINNVAPTDTIIDNNIYSTIYWD